MDEMIGGLPSSVLGSLADLCLKLRDGSLTKEQLEAVCKKQNPFGSSATMQLEKSLHTVGLNDEDIMKLAGDMILLSQVEALQHGSVKIVVVEHFVDFGKSCRLPFDGAKLEVHRGSGLHKLEKRSDGCLYVDGRKVEYYLSDEQKDGRVIHGHKLRKELETRGNNLPGIAMDFLRDNPAIWPEDLKDGRYLFFWDDIYRGADDRLFVRYAFWYGGEVVPGCSWLGLDWDSSNPAASLASPPPLVPQA